MIESFIRVLLRYRLVVSIIIIFFLLIGGFFITRIKVDNDTLAAIPSDIKPRQDYEALKKLFPSPFNILFLAEFSEGTLSEKIDSLRTWSAYFGGLPGVIGITDLTTLKVPVKKGFLGLSSGPVVPPADTGIIDEPRIRKMITENVDFCRPFISEDETRLGMIIALDWSADRMALIDSMLVKIQAVNSGDRIQTYLTSEGAISYFIDKSMHHDFRLLLPICFVLIFILLYRVFRNMLHVIASVTAVATSLVFTFGIMGMMHIPFSIVASIIPVIIFPIGVADAIHLIRTYSSSRKTDSPGNESALITTYRELLMPCFLTSITTFAGFASFSFSKIEWNRTFGIFTGIAVLFCYLFNVIILPIFLSFEKTPSDSTSSRRTREEHALTRFWDFFTTFTLKTRRWMLLLPLLLVILIIGIQKTRFENNFMMMLPPENQLRKSDHIIAQQFGGTRFFSVVLQKKENTITTAGEWRRIDTLSHFIENIDGIGSVTSLMPLISKVSMMLSKQPISSAAVSLITSSESFFGKSYGSLISNFLSSDRTKTRLQITARSEKSVEVLAIADTIEAYMAEYMPDYSVLISGPAILAEAMSSVLVNTLTVSLILTCIPVFLCLVIFFRSLRIGIYCILPIMLLISFVYALMGLFNVSVNIITVVIMNTCVGIGIDYAIHFISGYRHAIARSGNAFDALVSTIHQKGTPILFNTLVVGVGFCVLFFSSFPPIRDFGILVFISMFVAAGFCIFIISLLIKSFGLAAPSPRKES